MNMERWTVCNADSPSFLLKKNGNRFLTWVCYGSKYREISNDFLDERRIYRM